MTVIALSTNNLAIKTWEQSITLDAADPTLGMKPIAAVAYLFGQALSSIKFQDTQDGVQLSDARFVFPPPEAAGGTPNRVTITELADALHYKYGIDPAIEFAPGIGLLRGYTVADVNNIIDALNREFADAFAAAKVMLPGVALGDVMTSVGATNATETAPITKFLADTKTYLAQLTSRANSLNAFYKGRDTALQQRIDGYNRLLAGHPPSLDAEFGDVGLQLAGISVGIGALADLTAALNQDGLQGLQQMLDQTRQSSGKPDIFAWLKDFDVDPNLLFQKDQSSFWCNTPVYYPKYDGALRSDMRYVRADLDWTKPDLSIAKFNPNLEPGKVITELYSFESDGGFVAFNWSEWKAGTEVKLDFLNSTPVNYRQTPLTAYQGAATGYSDAAFADLVNIPFDSTATRSLLAAASNTSLTPATSVELRRDLTEGGDIYTDRFGAFYINGVRTKAMDLAITSRLLAQDNMSAEYKTLMDGLSERNNLITAARAVLSGGLAGLGRSVGSLGEQYGMADVLSELTAGQFSDVQSRPGVKSTDVDNESVSFYRDPGWITGTPVTVNANGNGLFANQTYYVRNLGSGNYSFFRDEDFALGFRSENPVNLTASITQDISVSSVATEGKTTGNIESFGGPGQWPGTPRFQTHYRFIVPSSTQSELFVTGARFQVGADVNDSNGNTILVQGQDYYIRKESGMFDGSCSIYPTAGQARTGNDGGIIFFPNTMPRTLIFQDIFKFSFPVWPTGTAVQVDKTSGGLTAGTTYYVRSMDSGGIGGNYSFFSTAAQAAGTGMDGIIPLSGTNPGKFGRVEDLNRSDAADFTAITALLNTLISNKTRDGDLDQAKLQTLTAQLQNNTEAMTALIKAFSDMNSALAQALR